MSGIFSKKLYGFSTTEMEKAIQEAVEQAVDIDELTLNDPKRGERGNFNGLVFYRDATPFTGWTHYKELSENSGAVIREVLSHIEKGVYHGLSIEWYQNGQKRSEGTYKHGYEDGLWTHWYSNGQKKSEVTYVAQVRASYEDGPAIYWFRNGQKKMELSYVEGEEISAKYYNIRGEEVGTEIEAR